MAADVLPGYTLNRKQQQKGCGAGNWAKCGEQDEKPLNAKRDSGDLEHVTGRLCAGSRFFLGVGRLRALVCMPQLLCKPQPDMPKLMYPASRRDLQPCGVTGVGRGKISWGSHMALQ
jgi:hypothetical protein